ncbi:MAG: hypothetical protein HYY06_06865 [Deltaproteobacteria bacterium]|nr:hypothetical protein [Deltaproteobacteria bacterium]
MTAKALRALVLVALAGFIAAPVPGDDLGSCSSSTLRPADSSQHCKDRYRTLCGKAAQCGMDHGAPCTEAAVTEACATAFWPDDCPTIAERDALHCIELLGEMPCDELADPVERSNVEFCDFCGTGGAE